MTCAEEVFDGFLAGSAEVAASLVLVDTAGVVRVRRDGDRALAGLLDGVLFVPGYGYAEQAVGTTAASISLHDQTDIAISGPEHYHSQLRCLGEAAALVVDPHSRDVRGVVVVICHQSDETTLQPAVAQLLAHQVTERMAAEPHRRSQTILDRFARACGDDRTGHVGHVGQDKAWVLATDGDYVLTNVAACHLEVGDLRVLSDLVLASLSLRDFARQHVELPSGGCAEVVTEAVQLGDDVVGCLLTGAPTGVQRSAEPAEAVRRQGSHVAPMVRRDYAQDLRGPGHAQKEHAEARIRANRELLSPFLRARREVVVSIQQGRNHLLIGEPGVGKQTLVINEFRQAYGSGRVVTVDCRSFAAERSGAPEQSSARTPPGTRLLTGAGDRPHLLVLRGMNLLTPIAARCLDETLRPLVALPSPPLLVGCIDTPAVDATRPYGLLLRHFHEITRVPALRYRADEIGEIALSILHKIAARRSLRLSLQVIRVLEGYAWPGNISELQDVLRYVVTRKPIGEVQPPDLPQLCFQGRARKMSMLEAAQCDAIIQALYESRGNRYKAAAMLGIARSSLYRKIDAFGISYIA
ncbi:helix-turn-helix domain-containing protein [Frankia sp. CcWB2]